MLTSFDQFADHFADHFVTSLAGQIGTRPNGLVSVRRRADCQSELLVWPAAPSIGLVRYRPPIASVSGTRTRWPCGVVWPARRRRRSVCSCPGPQAVFRRGTFPCFSSVRPTRGRGPLPSDVDGEFFGFVHPGGGFGRFTDVGDEDPVPHGRLDLFQEELEPSLVGGDDVDVAVFGLDA